MIEKLKIIISEWKEEADFLMNNSVGSDISVGQTYSECAKELEKILSAEEQGAKEGPGYECEDCGKIDIDYLTCPHCTGNLSPGTLT